MTDSPTKILPISATFLDEISHDIPHQNWGKKEWDTDFAYMKKMGIDTVVLIRCGYKRWMTFPSKTLYQKEQCFVPPTDLVRLFLELAEQYNFKFYFGLYDSGKYWETGDYQGEIDINRLLIDEVWANYGQYKAFKGWYICHETSRLQGKIIELYTQLGNHCKQVSNNLSTLISPYIDGKKALLSSKVELNKQESISLKQHENEWNEILDGVKDAVDIIAFQDGHVGFAQLKDYFTVNKMLADRYGLHCWTNAESFDRDMPIKFLPIKWEKLLLKLQAAQEAKLEKAITFEFSHFMSPQSAYVQAHHLFNRYQEYLGHEFQKIGHFI